MARPSDYSLELAAVICDRMAEGESLRTICKAEDMPARSTVFLWLAAHKEFSDLYARATDARAHLLAEEILEISDDGRNDTYKDDDGNEMTNHDVIARSRLRVDSRKWLAARLAPRKYGDKITQEHTGADGGPIKQEVSRIELVAAPFPANMGEG
ncbi:MULTISPECIES: terminase small subunit protein [unclassified Bradyrhizobium]|uniref:terminase small subunit-like protein n=1 Tax=unclassified Bradyrhizobium TaxID=2631580 RepID=UPI001BA88A5F|nr:MULTISPECIES: terminase small subunit protein [unclassified Bradyrhizobium]MBR1206601.1 terminase small subunit protein [Bradyrhizobium sp. AUGA SZCCT0124]MBR1315421.1 terminase small subunit protein [Bradyrhizobium sp. AUGA SZCCT0051]MBR1338517.1 terminase small subunit protein [Bradyrhizobium sp. AUGA SZCCT0105]MBR1356172.1 terminase small subunit protein [Bradyrhizobium sp. AUGA SZCCT0045]